MTKEIPLTRGLVAIVDDEDYNLLSQWKWKALPAASGAYAVRQQTIAPKTVRTVIMHRLITNAPTDRQVDHINGNPLDNRRENLRLATDGENKRNRGSLSGSSSRYKGVWWGKSNRKWLAMIESDGKQQYLGQFDKEEDAARAYDQAAREVHGAFARLNFND